MLKDIKQMEKFKAFVKGGLSDDGEFSILDITINKELQKALKEIIVKGDTQARFYIGSNADGESKYTDFKRHLVKSVFFSSLTGEDKNILFSKDLLSKGKTRIEFLNIPRRNEFKANIENALNTLMRTILNCEFEQTIVFKVNPDGLTPHNQNK